MWLISWPLVASLPGDSGGREDVVWTISLTVDVVHNEKRLCIQCT